MAERVKPVAAALAAITVALLVPGAPARAEVLGCDDSNRRCIDDVYSARCAERGTTRESCEALAREAEAAWSATRATGAGELLGIVYYRLARLADDDLTESRYLERARAVYLAVIDADEESVAAYQMMAVLDSENPEQHLAWQRMATAIDPSPIQIRFLTGALLKQGTEEAFVEVIDLLQDQYDEAPPGIDKWQWATQIHGELRFGALRFDSIVDPDALGELQARVRRDSDWDRILDTLSSPSSHAGDVATALETACRLTTFFGYEPCIDGIERTVLAARDPSERNAQRLADAAAHGIRMAPAGGMILDAEQEALLAARRQWAAWLTGFADVDLDSISVLEALDRLAETADRRLEVREEIVRREPGNGEAGFQLGAAYYGQERWAEAIIEFERARDLLPEDAQYRIDPYLRQARYERDGTP